MMASKLPQSQYQSKKLQNIILNIQQEFKLITVIGIEIEFYLTNFNKVKNLEKFLKLEIKKEKGNNQYEIAMPPSCNINNVIEQYYKIKQQITDYVHSRKARVFFTPKPFIRDFGNAMHIHINFLNSEGFNIFEDENRILSAMRAICHFMQKHYMIFMPSPEHYLRIKDNKMNPTNISIGKNNRTTMLRIPPTTPKRIEHRLPTPDLNLEKCIYYILQPIYYGMKYPKEISHCDIIYGNAFDPQYQCKDFIYHLDRKLTKGSKV